MIQRSSQPYFVNTSESSLDNFLTQNQVESLNDKNESDVNLTKNNEETKNINNNKLRTLNTYIKEEINQIRNAFQDDIDFHNKNEIKHDTNDVKSVVIERQGGLANRFVLLLLFLWYFFSALTLYTNKYIVTSQKADPTIIGTVQMIVTCVCGFVQLRFQRNKKQDSQFIIQNFSLKKTEYTTLLFWRNMMIIGFLRLFSIVLGLMALKQATISFVETVKSSSPLFTVILSRLLIGEITGFWTNVSLIPIMLGLALCSSFELNFSAFGFLAAILTNLTECLQNVFSKLLLCSDNYKYSPLEVQFFTSLGSVVALIPICYFSVDFSSQSYNFLSLVLFILNGISFNCQSLLAFTLMSYISPVTYSVCNTLKRAVLIWFSVIIFQNQVGYMSAIGTFLIISGVLFYNNSKTLDKQFKNPVTHKI